MSLGPDDPNHGSPTGNGEDFNWLYGNGASGAADDSTRVMPTIPRPGASSSSSSHDTPPPIAPGPGGRLLPPSSGGPKPPRVRVKWKRVVLLFVVLPLVAWLAFLIAVPAITWSKIERVDAFPSGARPAAGQGTNYLMVGSDSRRGLSAEQRKKLGLGNVAEDSGRTDTIIILHTGSGPTTLLSIPRDSWVPIPGYGYGKINSAFTYGGPKLLIKTIENTTGLYINHYVEVGLGGFVNAVDAVGGVQICPTKNLNDKNADLHVKKGCQQADGATALAWSRARDSFALGDLARGEHQRQIVHEVGSKAKSVWTFVLPWRYIAINNAAVNGLTVDKTMSIWNMISLARAMSSANKSCSMPLTGFGTPLYWDKTKALALIGYFKKDDTANIPKSLCTATGLPS